jgi:hypothetical protein
MDNEERRLVYIVSWFRGEGWDWVHLVRRPLIDLLCHHGVIDEYGEIGGMRIGKGNQVTGEKLFQPHFSHHKPHMNRPEIESGLPRWEAGDQPPVLWHGL